MTVEEPGREPSTEDLLRAFAPQVLGSLLRRGAPFDAAEDAVQEALVAGITTVANARRAAGIRGAGR